MMMDYSNNSNNLLLDFDTFSPEAIALEPEQIERAVELSNQIVDRERQWRTYLNALALFSFESWLQSRAPELVINSDNCSVLQPSYANVIDGVLNLEVGQFKLCLLASGTMRDEVVTVPRAVVDLPEYAAHFYVLVNVREEQEEAIVESFIPYDELKERQQSGNLQAEADWTYELPLTWFEPEPDNLLLYLRCLEPTATVLPAIPTDRLTALGNIQTELEPLIPQLQSSKTPLWQILSWDRAIPLLTSPELLDWLYRLQTGVPSATQNLAALTRQLAQTGQRLTQEAMNVGLWLQNELDELSQSLSWKLLPAPAFAMASLRSLSVTNRESPTEELEAIIAQLRNSGMDIPIEARGAYRDFSVSENYLRLYAVTWAIYEQETQPEWTLLVVLGAQPNYELPQGLKLQLKEQNTILDEQVVEQDTENSYLYTRVIGIWDEQFSVTIILANGETLVLPSFSFTSEQ